MPSAAIASIQGAKDNEHGHVRENAWQGGGV
jgi:hypothetical protein